jgi:predicted acetyltransferase
MTDDFRYARFAAEDEEAVGAIMRQAFASSTAQTRHYLSLLGEESFRVLLRGGPSGGRGEAAAALARIDFAHWFGGRAVPATGVAAVGTDPALRGRKAATRLIAGLLAELHDEGRPLSSLYPATLPLYRRAGYGFGGDAIAYRAALAPFASVRAPLGIERVPRPDPGRLAELRRREARSGNGLIERDATRWKELLPPADDREDGSGGDVFVFHGTRGPEGYAVIRRESTDVVDFIDLCAPTPEAALTAMALAAGYRSQVAEAAWTGGADDPLVLLAPEKATRVVQWKRWMLRVVDLPAAVAARGWPEDAEIDLHLDIDDPVLPANAGSWRLSASAGRAEAVRAPSGHAPSLGLGIDAFAMLYAGYAAPARIAALGLLRADAAALAAATRLFAGPRPWSVDFY